MKKLKILVVDSSPSERGRALQQLTRKDTQVRVAGDVKQALIMISEWRPHAVLSSLVLPFSDDSTTAREPLFHYGTILCHAIRHKVYFISFYSSHLDTSEAAVKACFESTQFDEEHGGRVGESTIYIFGKTEGGYKLWSNFLRLADLIPRPLSLDHVPHLSPQVRRFLQEK